MRYRIRKCHGEFRSTAFPDLRVLGTLDVENYARRRRAAVVIPDSLLGGEFGNPEYVPHLQAELLGELFVRIVDRDYVYFRGGLPGPNRDLIFRLPVVSWGNSSPIDGAIFESHIVRYLT